MRLLIVWIAALAAPLLPAQPGDRLTVGKPEAVVGKRNASVQVKIPLSVQKGFHVNSNKPKEEYLIPLKLTWTSTGALLLGKLDFLNFELQIVEFAGLLGSIQS